VVEYNLHWMPALRWWDAEAQVGSLRARKVEPTRPPWIPGPPPMHTEGVTLTPGPRMFLVRADSNERSLVLAPLLV
jgi:hypothetical protein